jgi:hypothetical protein
MDDRAVMRSFETGRGKRLTVLAIALVVVGVVIAFIVRGFGSKSPGADAISKPPEIVPTIKTTPTEPPPNPPTAP